MRKSSEGWNWGFLPPHQRGASDIIWKHHIYGISLSIHFTPSRKKNATRYSHDNIIYITKLLKFVDARRRQESARMRELFFLLFDGIVQHNLRFIGSSVICESSIIIFRESSGMAFREGSTGKKGSAHSLLSSSQWHFQFIIIKERWASLFEERKKSR